MNLHLPVPTRPSEVKALRLRVRELEAENDHQADVIRTYEGAFARLCRMARGEEVPS